MAWPSVNELQRLVERIGAQVGQVLERRGLIERDIENARLATHFEAGQLDDLIGHSLTCRIAVGPWAGQKLFTLQTVPPRLQGLEGDADAPARAGGFSVRAWLDIAPQPRAKLGPLDRMARLAALVPPPRMHLTRDHGVFGIEIDTCQRCGGNLRIIASVEQPEVIAKILSHLERTAPQPHPPDLPGMPGRGFGRADVG